MMLRISTLIAAATLAGALAAHPASAQDTTHHGGVNGAARAVSGAVKSTGRAVKSGVKTVGSKTHKVLKTTGRSTKSALSHAVGDTIHDPNHKPGGLNKAARDVSASIKHVGRSAKAGLHKSGSDTHKALQKTGNDVKKAAADTSHTTGLGLQGLAAYAARRWIVRRASTLLRFFSGPPTDEFSMYDNFAVIAAVAEPIIESMPPSSALPAVELIFVAPC